VADLWPWIAVAGLGALHGLNPASGWMFAAAWGVRTRSQAQVRHALLPIAIGHAVSVAAVAGAFAQGLAADRALVQGVAGALLVGAALYRLLRGAGACVPVSRPAGHAGMALWAFLMATAHGGGLMLVPALVPLCLADNPAREITASGSLALALGAVAVHTAAMLATTGVIATGVCRGLAIHPRLPGTAMRHVWTAALGVTGMGLLVFR
jgi:hypothetical protein